MYTKTTLDNYELKHSSQNALELGGAGWQQNLFQTSQIIKLSATRPIKHLSWNEI